MRRDIETALGCQVFDHYGAAEMAALVSQCEAGTYHVIRNSGLSKCCGTGARASR